LNFGGHSLTIVKLNSKIKEYLGVDLPITALFAAPSIEQLANVIRAGGWIPPRNCLIEIRPAGSKPPLFVMGPVMPYPLILTSIGRFMDFLCWGCLKNK
jgi:Phosphopantetheine attachment site